MMTRCCAAIGACWLTATLTMTPAPAAAQARPVPLPALPSAASPVGPSPAGPSSAGSPAAASQGALTLPAAVDLMFANNRVVRAAQRSADIAAAEIRRVDVLPNPVVSGQISNTEANRYPYGASDRILRVEQTIERGDKRRLRAATAQSAEQAARLDVDDAMRQQRAALTGAYFDLVAAQQLREVAAQNLDAFDRLTAAADRRVQAGDLATVDGSRLRIEQARAANDLRAAEAAREQARIALAAVLGLGLSAADLTAADPLPEREAIDSDARDAAAAFAQARDQAIERRVDVQAALARVRSAQRAAELAASLRTRDVTMGLQAERAPGFGGTVFGVSASVPLFINNDYSGDIARAQAELAAAQDDVERVRAAARGDIDRAYAQLRDAADRARRLLEQALPQALRVAQAIEFAFRSGAVTLTDLFDTRRQLAAVRADAVQAQADFAKALAAWRAAVAAPDEAAATGAAGR